MSITIKFILSVILIKLLNDIVNKKSKQEKNEVPLKYYIMKCVFILYLILVLDVVGFPSLWEWKMMMSLSQPIFNPHINLIPFKDMGIEDALNIVLFMPFGFFLPTLWRRYHKFWMTASFGLAFSLTIELSQLFSRSRVTDIDDLIMNGLGTVLGFMIFYVIRKKNYHTDEKEENNLFAKVEPFVCIIIVIICNFCF
ncbi:hypothetical protein NL50_05250 [Clostridium acetobutylicum]|nr:hypothetical protein NL50_05250 [Clostridium acetobutylicum]